MKNKGTGWKAKGLLTIVLEEAKEAKEEEESMSVVWCGVVCFLYCKQMMEGCEI